MASKKHFAGIDFQGGASIKVGGTAGNNQFLKASSDGGLSWASGTTSASGMGDVGITGYEGLIHSGITSSQNANFALAQSSGGLTVLNSKAGKGLYLRTEGGSSATDQIIIDGGTLSFQGSIGSEGNVLTVNSSNKAAWAAPAFAKLGTQTNSPLTIDGFSDAYDTYMVIGTQLNVNNSSVDYILATFIDENDQLITAGFDGTDPSGTGAEKHGRMVVAAPYDSGTAKNLCGFVLYIHSARVAGNATGDNAGNAVLIHGTSNSTYHGSGSWFPTHDTAEYFQYTLDWTNTSTAVAHRKVKKIVLQAASASSVLSTAVTGNLKLIGM